MHVCSRASNSIYHNCHRTMPRASWPHVSCPTLAPALSPALSPPPPPPPVSNPSGRSADATQLAGREVGCSLEDLGWFTICMCIVRPPPLHFPTNCTDQRQYLLGPSRDMTKIKTKTARSNYSSNGGSTGINPTQLQRRIIISEQC